MMRAKDNLHLIVPQRCFAHSQRGDGERHIYASRTRFIPLSILYCFEGCVWPLPAEAACGGCGSDTGRSC